MTASRWQEQVGLPGKCEKIYKQSVNKWAPKPLCDSALQTDKADARRRE